MKLIYAPLNLLGRLFLITIFLMSAVGNKIPKFGPTAEYMAAEGVPAPKLLLAGAIVFLIAGSLSIQPLDLADDWRICRQFRYDRRSGYRSAAQHTCGGRLRARPPRLSIGAARRDSGGLYPWRRL